MIMLLNEMINLFEQKRGKLQFQGSADENYQGLNDIDHKLNNLINHQIRVMKNEAETA